MELSWKGVHLIELDEFYSGTSFVFVGESYQDLRKFIEFYGFFFHDFVNFLVGQEGHLRKLINVSNRAQRVVCWSTLCFVWSTAWANPTGKYSNPDVRYPTCFFDCLNYFFD